MLVDNVFHVSQTAVQDFDCIMLKIFLNLFFYAKCRRTRSKNIFHILVFTELKNGGLECINFLLLVHKSFFSQPFSLSCPLECNALL